MFRYGIGLAHIRIPARPSVLRHTDGRLSCHKLGCPISRAVFARCGKFHNCHPKPLRSRRCGRVAGKVTHYTSAIVLLLVLGYAAIAGALDQPQGMQISVSPSDGSYSVEDPAAHLSILKAGVDLELNGHWLHSSSYPKRTIVESTVGDDLGTANEWTVTFSGLSDQPDFLYHLRAYSDKPFGDIQVIVHNGTSKPVHVESIRVIAATGGPLFDLGGPFKEDRVLSDSFSEDRPNIRIHDLADATHQMHRGVGSQVIYNRRSHRSFFVGALTSDHFLTVLRLHITGSPETPQIASYEAESTGTTELLKDNSLRRSSADDLVPLDLEVAPDSTLASERLLFSVDSDYHRQLETYGSIVKQLHRARVTSPTLMGWWSWIPYYFGLNEGAALTEAQWLSQHLKSLGYDYFVMDEGYQYARGEYSTPDASLFPHGVANLESKVRGLGLVPGIWTAPFEVTERSWVYQNHLDWLVHNAKGEPIHAGWGSMDKTRYLRLTRHIREPRSIFGRPIRHWLTNGGFVTSRWILWRTAE